MSERSERFIKFIPSTEAIYLLTKKGHAFRLLTIIAEAARRYEGGDNGLHIGEAFIGGFENYDMSEQNYRTAKKILEKRGHIEIIETCRTRKSLTPIQHQSNTKVTTEVTTVGTKVKLLSSNVYDINIEDDNDRINERLTIESRPTNDKLRKKERNNIRKEHLPTSSFSTQHNLYNKTLSDSANAEVGESFISFGKVVKLQKIEYEDLCTSHGKIFIDDLIEEMNDYCLSTRTQGYKNYFSAIREWIKRRKNTKSYNSNIDRRTQHKDGTPISSPADGRF